jgi:hypothetical protein
MEVTSGLPFNLIESTMNDINYINNNNNETTGLDMEFTQSLDAPIAMLQATTPVSQKKSQTSKTLRQTPRRYDIINTNA